MMKSSLRFGIAFTVFTAFLLSSCGYGFLNFIGGNSRVEIEFNFNGVNTKNIDKVEYEFTPPSGFSSSVTSEVNGYVERQELNNVSDGSWQMHIILYAGGVIIQEFDYGFEVAKELTTRIRIEASWGGDSYDLNFEATQDSEGADSDQGSETAFTFNEIRIKPGLVEDYNNGDQFSSVNVSVLGSSFNGNINEFNLIFPDGSIYEFGYLDYYGKGGIPLSHYIEDSRIEVQRIIGYGQNSLNGKYKLRMKDYGGNYIFQEAELDWNFSSFLPLIAPPAFFDAINGFTINYNFDSGITSGTVLHYLIDRATGDIFGDSNTNPPTDVSITGTLSGSFTVQPAQIMAGNDYTMVVVLMQHQTTTPVSDATAMGFSPELEPSMLVNFFNDVYGADTGYIAAKFIDFTAQ